MTDSTGYDPPSREYGGRIPEGHQEAVMQALLDVLSEADYVLVDAYPEPRWESFASLPEQVRKAHAHIADLGRQQRPTARDQLMAVEVDHHLPANKAAVAAFGPHSIYVVFVEGPLDVAAMDDCGFGCWARLTDEQHERFVEQVPGASEWFVPDQGRTRSGCFSRSGTAVALLLVVAAAQAAPGRRRHDRRHKRSGLNTW